MDEARLERLRQLERGFENTKAYFEKMDFSESCMKHAKRLTEISSALVIKEGETSSRSSSLSESSTGGNMRYMEPKELAESENTEKEGVMTKFERNDHGGEVGAADLDSENGGFESKIGKEKAGILVHHRIMCSGRVVASLTLLYERLQYVRKCQQSRYRYRN